MKILRDLTNRVATRCIATLLVFLPSSALADFVISSDSTEHVHCADGTCKPTHKNAVLNTKDLRKLLSKSDVQIVTDVKTPNLRIENNFAWGNSQRLTLDAYGAIEFDRSVTVQGTSGVTLDYQNLSFGKNAALQFVDPESALIMNGVTFTLVANIDSLSGAISKNPAGNYALSKNYDAAVDGVYSTSPVSTQFSGRFEGLGNRISHLTINAAGGDNEKIGFFASVTGVITNFGLASVNVTAGSGSYESVGGIAGDASTVQNSWATGKVSAGAFAAVGGLAGGGGNLTNSHFSGAVSGADSTMVGGMAGNLGGLITSCWSSGSVVAGDNALAGGLVGEYASGMMLSHSSANVVGGNSTTGDVYAGGLVGYMDGGSMSRSFATGSVRAGENKFSVVDVGGLLGAFSAHIVDSYATGAALGGDGSTVGGLAGESYAEVIDSYSIGRVQGGLESVIGGLVGRGFGQFKHAYRDIGTSGQKKGFGYGNFNGKIIGLSTDELQSGLPNGFNEKVWAQESKSNNGFPFLIYNLPL